MLWHFNVGDEQDLLLLFVLWNAEEKSSKVLGVKLEMKVNLYGAL